MRVEGGDPGIDGTQGEGEKYLGGREKNRKGREEEGRRGKKCTREVMEKN